MALNIKNARKSGGKRAAETAEGAEGEAQVKATALRIKELVERVGAKSEVKRKDLREVVEVTLAEIGTALAAGEGLNLPGLGHLRITRTAENGVLTMRLRKADPDAPKKKGKKAAEGDAEALADAGEAE